MRSMRTKLSCGHAVKAVNAVMRSMRSMLACGQCGCSVDAVMRSMRSRCQLANAVTLLSCCLYAVNAVTTLSCCQYAPNAVIVRSCGQCGHCAVVRTMRSCCLYPVNAVNAVMRSMRSRCQCGHAVNWPMRSLCCHAGTMRPLCGQCGRADNAVTMR